MQALCECDLSVIVPVYNLENFISPLLRSLNEQKTHYKVEYIFVMNNCTDRSEELIRGSIDCKILYCSIQSCGSARNVGLKEAKGNYIWMMDGDDWLLSDNAIEEVLDEAYGNNLNILRVPFESNKFTGQYFSMVWQYVFKRSFIEGFRFPDIQPSEDDIYTNQVLAKAGFNRFNYLSLPSTRPLYYYNYLREGSNMYRHWRGEKI